MSLRVAVVGACPYPVPQGSQVYLGETAHAIALAGHEVRLVVYGHGDPTLDAPFPIDRAPRLPWCRRTAAGPSTAKPLLDALLVATLRRAVREHRVDVVCAHNSEGLLVALAARCRPVVYFAHHLLSDELPHYFPQVCSNTIIYFGHLFDAAAPRRADLVVAPHQRLAEALIRLGCEAARVRVVPPSVDAEAFTPCSAGEAMPPVLYTGNLDRYQNLPLLHESMRLVREELPDARLRVALHPPASPSATYRREINRLHGSQGAEIVLVEDLPSLAALLSEDAVVAVPRVSWSGYPIKLLNAMAAGHAVVACESAAPPILNEENGLLVPDNDAPAFARAIARCLKNRELRARLGANAHRTVIELHSRPVAAAAFDAALQDAMALRQ